MKRMQRSVLACLLLALTMTAATAQVVYLEDELGHSKPLYAGSYALLIGVSDYTNGWPDLPQVADDVTAVAAVLKEHDFQVEVQMNPPDYEALDRIMRTFIYDEQKGQEPENRLLIYFAGHGHTLQLGGKRQMGYLVAADAPLPSLDRSGFLNNALDMETIGGYARNISAKHALFVFDSCFAGTVFDATRAAPLAITYKAAEPVRQFITSGSADQEVPATSLFRPRFVEALRGSGDLDGDGYITGTELGYVLNERILVDSRRTYHPQYGKILDPHLNKGDFVFQLPNRPTPAPQAPTGGQFVLDDLEAQAQTQEQWQAYQQNLESAFAQVQEYDGRSVTADLKRAAWQRFAEAFSQDNPFSDRDDQLRAAAQERLRYWQNYREPTPAPQAPLPVGEGPGVGSSGEWTDPLTGMAFVRIPPGCFMMGSPDTESGRGSDEGPVHEVCLDGFWMGKYEVTQAQWQAVMGSNPAWFNRERLGKDTGHHPVEQVSWHDVQEFITKLNAATVETHGRASLPFRLPTEAEWEYAARAGTTTPFHFGPTITTAQVNYDGNYPYGSAPKGDYRRQTTPVGSFPANAFGLHDMHGNVWEWCADWYAGDYYATSPRQNPPGPDGGQKRVLRGGSWNNRRAGHAFRRPLRPARRRAGPNVGFRLVRTE
jgi:formylglycine-generating enzyme required for sulfatase activity